MSLHAIIPARSGSKRFSNKNITSFLNIPLFYHSIFFAKKLKFVKKIIFSTDNDKYIKIAKKIPNIIIHKRNIYASKDNSMEEDILFDLKRFYNEKKINFPKNILWLRPTHPLRSIKTFKRGYNLFKKNKNSTLIVHETDSRLFYSKNNLIYPINNLMKYKSMLRGQDSKPLYKIFSGEFFKFPKKYNKKFLGDKRNFVVAAKETNFDIDDELDLKILESLIKNSKVKYKNFIHVK